jgi:hypothetical protein
MFDRVGTAVDTVGNASNGERSTDHCAAGILNIVATADSAGSASTPDSEHPNTARHIPARGAPKRRKEQRSRKPQPK